MKKISEEEAIKRFGENFLDNPNVVSFSWKECNDEIESLIKLVNKKSNDVKIGKIEFNGEEVFFVERKG